MVYHAPIMWHSYFEVGFECFKIVRVGMVRFLVKHAEFLLVSTDALKSCLFSSCRRQTLWIIFVISILSWSVSIELWVSITLNFHSYYWVHFCRRRLCVLLLFSSKFISLLFYSLYLLSQMKIYTLLVMSSGIDSTVIIDF